MSTIIPQFLRRKDAGAYLKAKFGFSSSRALAKLATIGGGPPFHRAGANGRIILYIPEELDQWALTKIGKALRSTAEQ
jgi:hypothetical protein